MAGKSDFSWGVIEIDFAKNLENHTSRENKLLVRTSHFSMEEFDRNKIVHALNREAGVPLDLAQKIAEETEERLQKLGTLYLTASLIREFVNSILVEKGLHEYRHSLSRLGIPVDDVTQLIKKAEINSFFSYQSKSNSISQIYHYLISIALANDDPQNSHLYIKKLKLN